MSTHNICFHREIRKILCGYPLLSVAMHTYYKIWTSPFYYVSEWPKTAGWVVDSEDQDQTPHYAASYLCLHCLLWPVCPSTLVEMVIQHALIFDTKYIQKCIQYYKRWHPFFSIFFFIFQTKLGWYFMWMVCEQFTWNVKPFFWFFFLMRMSHSAVVNCALRANRKYE